MIPCSATEEVIDRLQLIKDVARGLEYLHLRGVVHGDFNEFNILIKMDGSYDPVLIDFPQMISINHELAQDYFNRDVNCIVEFFAKRFHYESDFIPVFEPSYSQGNLI